MLSGHLQEKSGHWYAVLNVLDETSGKRKPKWIATHLPVKGNKKRAEQMLTELRIRYTDVERMRANTNGMLFADYMKSWLAGMEGKVAPSTYASYRNLIHNSICPFFGERGLSLSDLRPCHIEEYYEQLRRQGVSNNTILRHHANIRKALQEAWRKDLIPFNPADRVERPQKEDFIPHPYTTEEANQLLEAIQGEKLELVVTLTLFYGLRRSEVLGLRWCVIDFEHGTMTINHTITQNRAGEKYALAARDKVKRNASYRTLPLIDEIRDILLSIKAQQNPQPEDYICLDENGSVIKPNYVTQEFAKLLKRKGLRQIRFHDLRHSAANLLIGQRVPLIEVQQWLGHSNISTTADLYAHLEFATKLNSATTMKKI